MAAVVRKYFTRSCSFKNLGWSVLSRYRMESKCPQVGDNLSSLCRRFSSSLSLQNPAYSTRSTGTCAAMSNRLLMNTNYNIHGAKSSGFLQAAGPTVLTSRSKIYYSKNKGKEKTVKSVVKRFYRLNWGIWIRTRAGRAKRLWRKTESRKYRLRQHVFCNGQQSRLLDKMASSFYRKPKYYIDDPYEPYQQRTNFADRYSERKPFYP